MTRPIQHGIVTSVTDADYTSEFKPTKNTYISPKRAS